MAVTMRLKSELCLFVAGVLIYIVLCFKLHGLRGYWGSDMKETAVEAGNEG